MYLVIVASKFAFGPSYHLVSRYAQTIIGDLDIRRTVKPFAALMASQTLIRTATNPWNERSHASRTRFLTSHRHHVSPGIMVRLTTTDATDCVIDLFICRTDYIPGTNPRIDSNLHDTLGLYQHIRGVMAFERRLLTDVIDKRDTNSLIRRWVELFESLPEINYG